MRHAARLLAAWVLAASMPLAAQTTARPDSDTRTARGDVEERTGGGSAAGSAAGAGTFAPSRPLSSGRPVSFPVDI